MSAPRFSLPHPTAHGPALRLSDGSQMPTMGFGTFLSKPNEVVRPRARTPWRVIASHRSLLPRAPPCGRPTAWATATSTSRRATTTSPRSARPWRMSSRTRPSARKCGSPQRCFALAPTPPPTPHTRPPLPACNHTAVDSCAHVRTRQIRAGLMDPQQVRPAIEQARVPSQRRVAPR
jgi:hypothetical protein